MNWNRAKIKWQVKKSVNDWKNMLNDERTAIVGKYDQFMEILQNNIGDAKKEARRQVDALKTIVEQFRNPAGN
jgi:uncharacterized protein YjbJ (UPF0337 family)